MADKKPNYDDLMRCVEALGVEETFTQKALDILLEYKDAGDDVIFPLIILLGEEAFTEKAKEFML